MQCRARTLCSTKDKTSGSREAWRRQVTNYRSSHGRSVLSMHSAIRHSSSAMGAMNQVPITFQTLDLTAIDTACCIDLQNRQSSGTNPCQDCEAHLSRILAQEP